MPWIDPSKDNFLRHIGQTCETSILLMDKYWKKLNILNIFEYFKYLKYLRYFLRQIFPLTQCSQVKCSEIMFKNIFSQTHAALSGKIFRNNVYKYLLRLTQHSQVCSETSLHFPCSHCSHLLCTCRSEDQSINVYFLQQPIGSSLHMQI